jgi:AcrR family transcriptional regulator
MTVVMTAVMRSNRTLGQTELRAIIYDAAIRRFRTNGYARTTVDEIVALAGVAKGTFFNFFPAKLDVLKAYYDTIDAQAARCRAGMSAAAPLSSLRRYACAVEKIFLREGPLMLELIDAVAHEPAISRIDTESGAADAADFARFLLEVRRRGLIAADVDPEEAADAVLDLWSGSVRAWLGRPAKGSLGRLFHQRLKLLFHGLGYAP